MFFCKKFSKNISFTKKYICNHKELIFYLSILNNKITILCFSFQYKISNVTSLKQINELKQLLKRYKVLVSDKNSLYLK